MSYNLIDNFNQFLIYAWIMTTTRMAALRGRLEWTQAAMADYLGLSQAQISNIENGTAEKGPLVRVLDTLAIEKGWADLTADKFQQPQAIAS